VLNWVCVCVLLKLGDCSAGAELGVCVCY
jgi:hypothetical protein